jgi:hypothetical protein
MHNRCRIMPWILRFIAAPALLFATLAAAQTRPAAPIHTPALTAPAQTDKELADTQDQLIKLLRLSPTLTTVVASDPSLLSNRDYVNRNNPQLANYLASHPEIVRNPEFYLFTRMDPRDRRRDQALERRVWPELVQANDSGQRNSMNEVQQKANDERQKAADFRQAIDKIVPMVLFLCILTALIWLTRAFLQNRRWNRIFKMQSEMQTKLIEKFGSSQELLAYLETEAGKRFLEAAPLPNDSVVPQRVPNAAARVLTMLQAGIVLTLLGAGLFILRFGSPEMGTPMLVLGTVVLMPGLGFIISAGIAWSLASRLGLTPEPPAAANKPDQPFESQERL